MARQGWTNGHTIAAIGVGVVGVLTYQWWASRRAAKSAAR